MNWTSSHAGVVLLALVTSTCGYAADDPADAAGQVPAQSSARVYVNPQTGEVGGPPPGVQPPGLSVAEQKMLSRSSRGLEVRTLPSGAMLLNLQGRFRNMSTASVNADGEVELHCSEDRAAVESSLAGRAKQ